ncbi:MAG TPA: DUF2844 domain-containing protein [Verrucomicrobiae bacterium]|nr:DUF2844 domain-containing protein [Verrucomicrobiae bacterium]
MTTERNRPKCAVAVAVLVLGLISGVPAFAALGDTLESVKADQKQMRASAQTTEADDYTILELKLPVGTVVREYVSRSDGHVFAVTWQGPFIPDLQQLLGSYFQQYSKAATVQRQNRIGLHSLDIRQPGLVFENVGHMLDYAGRAYDPRLLPSSVTPNDIR